MSCLQTRCRHGYWGEVIILNMPAVESRTLWSQELEVHWPPSWRSVTNRDVLLEMFAPQVFSVSDDTLFIRYGENQDLRISQFGMHLRILSLDSTAKRIAEVFEKILLVVEPDELHELEASFSHILPLSIDYDTARKQLARVYYSSWMQNRSVSDFALYWDERSAESETGHFELGVVNQRELISRVAQAAGISQKVMSQQTPAWMKVRMPQVAVFLRCDYTSKVRFTADLGRAKVPQTWGRWREESTTLFNSLAGLAIPAREGELS